MSDQALVGTLAPPAARPALATEESKPTHQQVRRNWLDAARDLFFGDSEASSLLEPQDRLAYERGRLPVRLALSVAPALLLLNYGWMAGPTVGLTAAAIFGSSAVLWTLSRRWPESLLRWQLGWRLVDVCLVYMALMSTYRFTRQAGYDAVYLLSVISATATHGRRGGFLIATVATLAALVGRLQLAEWLGQRFDTLQLTSIAVNSLIFYLTGTIVSFLMRTSGEVVLRREGVLNARLADRNETLERTAAQLAATNKELEAFAYSVSHDLRAPLRSIDGFSRVLLGSYGEALDERGRDYLQRVRGASQRMSQLIDDLLGLSRLTRTDLRRERCDLSAMARGIVDDLRARQPDRQVEVRIQEGITVRADSALLRIALENLLGNAWKFTGRREAAHIEIGSTREGGETVYFVRDNGAGFDIAYSEKLFGAFQRLHGPDEFEGSGIGLATVQRIVNRHGGRIWAQSTVDLGATFLFTL